MQGIAQILTKTVREADLVCRWGGEEFVIFLNKCDVVDAERIAEQIRTKVATQTYEFELYHLNVTLSIGVASYRHDEPLKELMARADNALYEAKNTGRNSIVRH